MNKKLVAVIYGSLSDWEIMKHSVEILQRLEIPYHTQVVSAHRTPHLLFQFAESAKENGFEVVIAGAGGAAHLPGMISSLTTLPVLGVPIPSSKLEGMDALLSIAQMPGGIPVGTLAIGKSGAINAALLAASILANKYENIDQSLQHFRKSQTDDVLNKLYPEL
ncbi:MAG: 5-(carboxyamino)imidazole ribonucleotide mutase [Gammaproteobacteria bacterium 39-13]|nr:5-(carboxyamino)imidazole ribonucleotide mutase [Gammaproteobacteria bacterium]OJV91677.1 MAG: 5-(carboxyamino)imidazole ribonucleotide mutase [Gammaproteobacteria bacterium 39-13]